MDMLENTCAVYCIRWVLNIGQIHILTNSVADVMVSIVAFQAVDPGSIPGPRTFVDYNLQL